MKNCHPTILLYLIKKYYPNETNLYPILENYIENRNQWLNEYKCDKLEIIKCMNSNIKKNLKSILY